MYTFPDDLHLVTAHRQFRTDKLLLKLPRGKDLTSYTEQLMLRTFKSLEFQRQWPRGFFPTENPAVAVYCRFEPMWPADVRAVTFRKALFSMHDLFHEIGFNWRLRAYDKDQFLPYKVLSCFRS